MALGGALIALAIWCGHHAELASWRAHRDRARRGVLRLRPRVERRRRRARQPVAADRRVGLSSSSAWSWRGASAGGHATGRACLNWSPHRPAAQRRTLAGTMVAVALGRYDPQGDDRSELGPPDGGDLPDVYYMILDRYAGPRPLPMPTTSTTAVPDCARGSGLRRRSQRPRQLHRDAPLAGRAANMEFLDAAALKDEAEWARIASRSTGCWGGHLVVQGALKELGYQTSTSRTGGPRRPPTSTPTGLPLRRPG